MANQILVNPPSMGETSSQIRKYKQSHQDVMKKLTNLVMSLGEVWQGDAQNAFVSKFFSMQSVYDSFAESLEEFADLVDKVSEEMQRTDAEGKSIISSIF